MRNLIKDRLISRTALIAVLAFGTMFPTQAQNAPDPTQKPATPAPARSVPPTSAKSSTEAISPATPEQLRQAQIQADTTHLYRLSLALRAEVANTYKESLSINVLKKAEELEKLAKKLRSEMDREAAVSRK